MPRRLGLRNRAGSWSVADAPRPRRPRSSPRIRSHRVGERLAVASPFQPVASVCCAIYLPCGTARLELVAHFDVAQRGLRLARRVEGRAAHGAHGSTGLSLSEALIHFDRLRMGGDALNGRSSRAATARQGRRRDRSGAAAGRPLSAANESACTSTSPMPRARRSAATCRASAADHERILRHHLLLALGDVVAHPDRPSPARSSDRSAMSSVCPAFSTSITRHAKLKPRQVQSGSAPGPAGASGTRDLDRPRRRR